MLVTDCGVDVNMPDEYTDIETCLHRAAKEGDRETLLWLIGAGADLDALDILDGTALHLACTGDHAESAITLLAAGADIPLDFFHTLDVRVAHAFVAVCADTDVADFGHELNADVTKDALLALEGARRDIAKATFAFVRRRALQVCIGLQSLGLDALTMCEILQFSCGSRSAAFVAFHQWWAIATKVKHFRQEQH